MQPIATSRLVFCPGLNNNLFTGIEQEIGHLIEQGNFKAIERVLSNFSDNEIQFFINESIRNATVYVAESTNPPAENYMRLFIMLDAIKRSSAKKIVAVIPYFGYARQDKKIKSREPISAKLMADLLEAAGAQKVITLDLHSNQIPGFFNIPVDHLTAQPVFLKFLETQLHLPMNNIVIIAPDAGGVDRARKPAKILKVSLATIDKRRNQITHEIEYMELMGDVDGKIAVLWDDIIDTGGTLCEGAELLNKKGATIVYACCSHAVLSGDALKRIANSYITKIIVTNSIPLSTEAQAHSKIIVAPVQNLIAEAMVRDYCNVSVSSLFQ